MRSCLPDSARYLFCANKLLVRQGRSPDRAAISHLIIQLFGYG